MTDDTIAIVDGPLSARAAVHLVSEAIGRAMPADPAVGPPAAERRAALRLASARLALLRDWEARNPRPEGACPILVATRWLELSSAFGPDGVLDYRGDPVRLDGKGRNPLPVPAALKAALRAWALGFRRRVRGRAPSLPWADWAAAHDAEGLRLAEALARELPRRPAWTVRLERLSGSGSPAPGYAAERPPRRGPAPPGPGPSWRFRVAPDDAPGLVAVHDLAGMRRALDAFRDVLGRWRALREAEPAYGQDDMGRWQEDDVLRQHLRAQCEVVLSWTAWRRGGLPGPDPSRVPRCGLQASRHVEVSEDYSSDGIWTWDGFPADPGDLPASEAAKGRLAAWIRLYEKAKGWDCPDKRPFELDEDAFSCMGAIVARAMKRDLPDWEIAFRGRLVENP